MSVLRKISTTNLALACLTIFIFFRYFMIRSGENVQHTKREAEKTINQNQPWPNDESNPVQQNDPALVDFVRTNFIFSPNSLPYNFDNPNITTNPSYGQLQEVLPLLQDTKDGFFIELGANDGEWGTNTLFLERELGWNGLLIEASPSTYEKMTRKNRKAWHSNVAVATKPHPSIATFYENPGMSIWGGLTYRFYHENSAEVKVQCIPLYTLLLAINQTVVDFFSLDLEGSELDVLRTIPFDKVTIKSLVVEVINGKEGPEAVMELMYRNGYSLLPTAPGFQDLVFINEEFTKKAKILASRVKI